MAITLQTTKYNVIYVYSRTSLPNMVKIGKTSVDSYNVEELTPNSDKLIDAVKQRLHDAITMGVNDIEILHAEVGYFVNTNGISCAFDDHAVHDVLIHSNYKKADIQSSLGVADEWFLVDLETAKKAITAVKNEQTSIDGPKKKEAKHPEIKFREEQKAAIDSARVLLRHRGAKMLWNAKMRFGKTLCALELINQLDVKKTLILTHRPTVRSGWYEDFHLIHFNSPILYGSKNGQSYNQCDSWEDEENGKTVIKYDTVGKDLQTLDKELHDNGKHFIYFASMQDLRGQEAKKGNKNKPLSDEEKKWKANNKLVFNTKWDLIILDEAHEGTETALGKSVIHALTDGRSAKRLYLSGTPYNILYRFKKDEIYTWDYVMEQEAKENWEKEHPNEKNPYEGLARLNIYTYNLGEIYANNPSYTKSEDDYFNFAEFFRTWTGDIKKDGAAIPDGAEEGYFVHEEDVKNFLDLLVREEPVSFYPYSNDDFRNALNHTLWMLPGVASANRLMTLINQHKLHTEYGYHVVSVAGEGNSIGVLPEDDVTSIANAERDALKKVKAALKDNKRTITLSCSRLTTGVSIPEWTGVFMLCGGYSTKASTYMQTIFRGQTPYKNGAIKSNCYAFDFAPDRTLTVIDDYVRQQPKSLNTGSTASSGITGAFERNARFMPIIAMVGGKEKEYSALELVHKVNSSYAEHVVMHGGKSRKLFKTNLSPADHDFLASIGLTLDGKASDSSSDGSFDMTNEGFKGDQNTTTSGGGKSSGQPKSPKKKNEEAEKNKQSYEILKKISTRFPLMLFGAVTDTSHLTPDEFLDDDVIDDESWKLFMPKNFKKEHLKQIIEREILKFDVLITSADIIINQAKYADTLPVYQRIVEIAHMLSTFHFPDKETVLTPWRVVNMHMSDTIGGYDFYDDKHEKILLEPRLVEQGNITSDIFCDENTRVLELNSKSGVYPLWIAHTLWRLHGVDGMSQEEEQALWKKVVEEYLYVVCMTPMAEKITHRVLAGYRTDIKPNICSFDNIVERTKDDEQQKELIKQIENPKTYNNDKEGKMLKFSAIVSNPPYQIMDGGAQASAAPIYHHFVFLAKEINPKYFSIIMPARWYSGGRGLDEFREKMLSDIHIERLDDCLKPDSIFPGTNIRGGLCYILWSKFYNNTSKGIRVVTHDGFTITNDCRRSLKIDGVPTFIRDEKGISILQRIKNNSVHYLEEYISTLRPFGFRGFFTNDENYHQTPDGLESPVLCYGKGLQEGYVERNLITVHEDWIDKWKLIMPRANNIGTELHDDNLNSFVSAPNTICTESYLVIGAELELDESKCYNIKSYLTTKFVRYLHSLAKSSQDSTAKTFAFVPVMDFSRKWTDDELFEKFNFSIEERQYIDSIIKPMSSQTKDTQKHEIKVEVHNHIDHADKVDVYGPYVQNQTINNK